MVYKKSLKKNMIMSILLTSSNFIFPLITYSYVARVLSPAGTGKVAFVTSVLSYFSYIAILGIPGYGLREAAKVRDNQEKLSQLVQELLLINFLSTLIAYILLFLAVLMVPRLLYEKDLFIVMGGYIFLSTIGVEWLYQALEEYSYITIRSLIFKCLSVVLTFILIKDEGDYLYYGFLHIFTNSASYILNFLHVKRYISFKKNGKYNIKRHVRPIITMFSASIIITIYANFDVIMLGFISTEYEVGLYNAALKIKSIVLSLSSAVTAVLIPRISYYLSSENSEKVKQLIEKSLRVSLNLAIPVAMFIFIFAKECLVFLCGTEYIGAVSTLRVLICCIIPLVLTNLFGNQLLIPLGMEKRYSQSVFVGMWINLGLNVILIPIMGAYGAAFGTLITEMWNVFWMSNGVKSYRNTLIKEISYRHYFIPMFIASFVSVVIGNVLNIALVSKLFIVAFLFFTIYYLFLIIEKEPLVAEQINLTISKFKKRVK